MKKIVFFFIFIFGFTGAHSQCNISADITMETHTKQCQACYKKIVYPKMYAKKVYWSSCPENIRSGYSAKLKGFFSYTFSQIYLDSYNYEKVIKLHDLGNSSCTESNSGRHLWKEINLEIEPGFPTTLKQIPNLDTDFYIELWEEISKKKPETFYMLAYLLNTFSDLDKL
jgi:hypothetical protein